LFVAIYAACNLHIRNFEEDLLQEEDTSPQINEVTIMKVNGLSNVCLMVQCYVFQNYLFIIVFCILFIYKSLQQEPFI